MEELLNVFTYFMIYSILGWMGELVWCSVEQKEIVKNRGFFFGPYCPIYGFGAIIIIYFLTPYKEDLLALFVISMIVCSILEYFTSWILEKLFNTRWWDYSNYKFNLEGRICLLNSTTFGLCAVGLVHFLHPFISGIINVIPYNFHLSLVIIVAVIFAFDFVMTTIGVVKLRKILKSLRHKKAKKLFFKKGIFKYGEELFKNKSKFTLLNIRHILKRVPRLTEPKDKEIKTILESITKKKK